MTREHESKDPFTKALKFINAVVAVSGKHPDVTITATDSTQEGYFLAESLAGDISTLIDADEVAGWSKRDEIRGYHEVVVSYHSDHKPAIASARRAVNTVADRQKVALVTQGEITEGRTQRALRRIIGTGAEDASNFDATDIYHT